MQTNHKTPQELEEQRKQKYEQLQRERVEAQPIKIVDVDIPLKSLAALSIKLLFASIPAAFVGWVLMLFVYQFMKH